MVLIDAFHHMQINYNSDNGYEQASYSHLKAFALHLRKKSLKYPLANVLRRRGLH